MNIQEAKTEISNTLKAYHRKDSQGNYTYPLLRQRPILLMGPPGIGKTAIMEQVAAECQVGLVAYTITHHTRQSAIGLPHIEHKVYGGQKMDVTEYTMSEIIASVYECMEKTKKSEGILFIDEINCVSETLAPTMLQFLQSKTFGSHKVPAGWMIVAAGNPPEYNKSVREFDVVTLDRVRKIGIDADCDVWMEYAWERKVHGAILSYLAIKKDHFYLVENTLDGKFFVTARGWEDLSEIMKSYEQMGVPVTEALVVQFLQKEEIAADFTVYYQLYCKYGEDYAIGEILEGKISQVEYLCKLDMARQAAFEERFTVVGLVLSYLDNGFKEYADMDSKTVALHETLGHFKEYLMGSGDIQTLLRGFTESRKDILQVKSDAQLLTGSDIRRERWVLERLAEYDLTLRKEHLLDKESGFARIRELFEQQVQTRAQLIGQIQERLGRAFDFVEACFGDEQEMVLFVTGLSRNRHAMEYIGTHGCEKYFQFSENMLYRKREKELKKACTEEL